MPLLMLTVLADVLIDISLQKTRAEDARLIYWTLELSANYGFSGG